MNEFESFPVDRRQALKLVVAAATSAVFLDADYYTLGAAEAMTTTKGIGTDPFLMKSYKPGDFWPLTFNDKQKRLVSVLCDIIIPEDDKSPAASAVNVPAFIDEWISAPYDGQQADRKTVLSGLQWIDEEARKRFKKGFVDLTSEQQHQICDDICYAPKAKPEFKQGANFFAKFRNLTAGGFYITKEGMKDVGYVGNVPIMGAYPGAPKAVKEKLGLV